MSSEYPQRMGLRLCVRLPRATARGPAYTKAGYVSGAISGQPTYPPPKEWTRDFGSILAFIEHNFGLNNIAFPNQYYADANAIDSVNGQFVPLWDFFQWPYRGFTSASPASGNDANYFLNYYTNTELSRRDRMATKLIEGL